MEVMIRNRLVCGINVATIQKHLLVEPKLTYAKAVEIAQSTEAAAQSMRELQVRSESDANSAQPTPVPTVNMMSMTSSESGLTCYCAVTRDTRCQSAR